MFVCTYTLPFVQNLKNIKDIYMDQQSCDHILLGTTFPAAF